MFLFKKVVAPLFSPVPLCLELLTVGLCLLMFTRKQRAGKVLVVCGVILLALLSTEGISGRLLHTLEGQYPTLDVATIQTMSIGEGETPVRWIVVLAGGIADDPTLPFHIQISHDSRVRLFEAIRVYHRLLGSNIILSGGIGFQTVPEATILSRVAQSFGVKKTDIVLEAQSRDTKDHPLFVKAIVENNPFILVTSAYHMPRAVRLFTKQGMVPIPAPAGRWKPNNNFWLGDLFPSSRGLRLAELAFHEYLGLGWAWVRGQI